MNENFRVLSILPFEFLNMHSLFLDLRQLIEFIILFYFTYMREKDTPEPKLNV